AEYTAPTLVGQVSVTYAEQGVSASKAVSIVHGALATISVTGPANLIAGTAATFQVAGLDAYANAVPLARSSVDFTAPTLAGATQVCYSEQGVTGCKALQVLPGALDHIVIDPASTNLEVTTTKDFTSGGFDRFNNLIDVVAEYTAQRGVFEGATYTAPTQSGTALVTAVTNGVAGSATVQVTPGALERLVITGPASVKAGTTAQYAVSGFDHFGNPVAVNAAWGSSVGSMASGAFGAPTTAGNAVLTVTQGLVTGTLTIAITPDALHHITVTAPVGALNVGRESAFSAAGYDRYGNVVNAPIQWSASSGSIGQTGLLVPDAPGETTVTAKSGAIQGAASVVVLGRLLATVGMDQESYLPTDALVAGVRGSVRATFLDGTPVAGGSVTAIVTHVSPIGTLRQTTITGVTDALGDFAFTVPQTFALVGDYHVVVTIAKLGNNGDAATNYHVGA
ncbi:MAG TPA: hypothetical protein VM370_08970, partial [Candidatus Thermoplasmatota archaeon]|nr:hypothetical protein [Candidatus Thermoplasmatota archaeon]